MKRIKVSLCILLFLAGLSVSLHSIDKFSPYAIIVSKQTKEDANWTKVVDKLKEKYNAKVFVFENNLDEIKKDVANYKPKYIAFVAKPEETTQKYVYNANEFCKTLDDDPYVDAIWGIVVAGTHEEALRMITSPKLVIKKILGKTSTPLETVKEGIFITENARDPYHIKIKKDGKIEEFNEKYDDTKKVVDELNTNTYQLIITSGHADPNGWELMYPGGGGRVYAKDGKLYATDRKENEYEITMDNNKVIYAIGNCLSALISGTLRIGWQTIVATPDKSLCLGWIHHGANQYLGAVDGTWHGAFWRNCWTYLFEFPGKYTYAQSIFLTRQKIHFQVQEMEFDYDYANQFPPSKNKQGCEYTERIFVLYGDPAYEARIDPDPNFVPSFTDDIKVVQKNQPKENEPYIYEVTYTLKANKNTSYKSFAVLLPIRFDKVNEIKTDIKKAVVANETLFWMLDKPLEKDQSFTITFTGESFEKYEK
jgi:hypothetical protein